MYPSTSTSHLFNTSMIHNIHCNLHVTQFANKHKLYMFQYALPCLIQIIFEACPNLEKTTKINVNLFYNDLYVCSLCIKSGISEIESKNLDKP